MLRDFIQEAMQDSLIEEEIDIAGVPEEVDRDAAEDIIDRFENGIEKYTSNIENRLPKDVKLYLDVFGDDYTYGQVGKYVVVSDYSDTHVYKSLEDFIKVMRYQIQETCKEKDRLFDSGSEEYQALVELEKLL